MLLNVGEKIPYILQSENLIYPLTVNLNYKPAFPYPDDEDEKVPVLDICHSITDDEEDGGSATVNNHNLMLDICYGAHK